MCFPFRFRTFEHGLKDIAELVDRWERASGVIRPVTPCDGAADAIEEQANLHPPSGKKGKKAGKSSDNKIRLGKIKANLTENYNIQMIYY